MGGRKARKRGKEKGAPYPLSSNPSLFPFLPIRYPQTKLCRKPSHSRTVIIQIQEALWRKSNNLRNPYLAVMKSSTFHKRSKRMLLHQRANQCRPAITVENHYACYDLSLRNKRKNRICSVKT